MKSVVWVATVFTLLLALFFTFAKVSRALSAIYNHEAFDADEWLIPSGLWTALYVLVTYAN